MIGDLIPMTVARPDSVGGVSDLVRGGTSEERAVFPLGGQTMLSYGLPPSREGMGIDLRALDQVIDYPARDMTITVQAGITIAKLQQVLAAENQRLPVDIPLPARATLAGALATNMSGPRRYGFGTLRDYVIGISVVNDEGHEIKAGGRVVKNVAGYDLCKLFIGSLGTLGIITQVTLKLKPRAERSHLMLLPCPAANLQKTLEVVHTSRSRPVCISVLNQAARAAALAPWQELPEADWLVVVGFEDNAQAVDWQLRQLRSEVSSTSAHGAFDCPEPLTDAVWSSLADFPLVPSSLTFKANLSPGQTGNFCRQAAALSEKVRVLAHAGNGIVIGRVVEDLTLDRAGTMLTTLLDAAVAAQGNVVLLHCPTAWKATLPVWGRPRGDFALMREVKAKLDPRRIFNPGRFVDGI